MTYKPPIREHFFRPQPPHPLSPLSWVARTKKMGSSGESGGVFRVHGRGANVGRPQLGLDRVASSCSSAILGIGSIRRRIVFRFIGNPYDLISPIQASSSFHPSGLTLGWPRRMKGRKKPVTRTKTLPHRRPPRLCCSDSRGASTVAPSRSWSTGGHPLIPRKIPKKEGCHAIGLYHLFARDNVKRKNGVAKFWMIIGGIMIIPSKNDHSN